MRTSADAPNDPDILLARLLACRNRDELTVLVRARPQLLDEPVEASLGELAAQRPDPAVARAHLRALRAMRGLRGELMALAGRADGLQRAFTASGNVAELTAAVSAWRAALAHPGVAVADAALLTAVRTAAGSALLTLAQHDGNGGDLAAAIRLLHEAIDGAPAGRPQRSASINLAAALRERGDPEDLQVAEELLTEVLGETDHDLRAVAATNLGHVRCDRYHATADPALLDAAEAAYRAALKETPAGSPRRTARLCHLATIGVERWRAGGRPPDLARAVDLLEQALAGADDSPSRMTALVDLAVTLAERYDHAGDRRDLDRAVTLAEQAGPAGVATLAALLSRRHEATGDPDDLRRLTELQPGGGIDMSDERPHTGVLLTLLDHAGDPGDFSAAVQAATRAVIGSSPVARPAALVNLAAALSARFAAAGLVADLEEAVEVYERAVAATPPGSPQRASRLADLGDALRERADRLGRAGDIDRAVAVLADALAATPVGAPDRGYRLAVLATATLARHRRRRNPADLPAALHLSRLALDATPPGASDRAARLGLYAACLHRTWQDTRDPALLEQAIKLHRDALDRTPADSPMRWRRQQNLADALVDRGDPTDNARARSLFADAYRGALDRDPWAAVAAARNWGAAAARREDWPEAAHAFLSGLRLVFALVDAQTVRRHQEGWLRDARQLPAEAARALARLGRHDQAVAALDAGRAVLLTGAIGHAR